VFTYKKNYPTPAPQWDGLDWRSGAPAGLAYCGDRGGDFYIDPSKSKKVVSDDAS